MLTIYRLAKVWLDASPEINGFHGEPEAQPSVPHLQHEESASSSVSLGDTHIWREAAHSNV